MEGEGQTERGGVEEAKKAWLRRERLLTPVFWPGEFHGWYSPWGAKSRTQLSDFRIPHTMLSAGRGRGTLSLLHFLLGGHVPSPKVGRDPLPLPGSIFYLRG